MSNNLVKQVKNIAGMIGEIADNLPAAFPGAEQAQADIMRIHNAIEDVLEIDENGAEDIDVCIQGEVYKLIHLDKIKELQEIHEKMKRVHAALHS